MNYWLLKSEPTTFGIDDLERAPRQTTSWDGVRNYQARNYLRTAQRGDEAFLYHSNCPQPGIVAIMRVVRIAYPDASAFDRRDPHFDARSTPDAPRWYTLDVQLLRRLQRVITLQELRAHAAGKLHGLALLAPGSRLSVLPVTAAQWRFIVALEHV